MIIMLGQSPPYTGENVRATVMAASMLARIWGLRASQLASMFGSALGPSDPASPSTNTQKFP